MQNVCAYGTFLQYKPYGRPQNICQWILKDWNPTKHYHWPHGKKLEIKTEEKLENSQVSQSHSVMSDFVTPRTVAHHAPLSMEFSRQEYWRGLPCPHPGDDQPGSSKWQLRCWMPRLKYYDLTGIFYWSKLSFSTTFNLTCETVFSMLCTHERICKRKWKRKAKRHRNTAKKLKSQKQN